MKRQTLVNGLLSLTVVSLMTGCVDDKYDLSDIDTTSRFIVDNLTVPVGLEPIELKNVIDIDDDDPNALVKEDPATGKYVLSENGGFDPTTFSVGEVIVAAPVIPQISFDVPNRLPSGVFIPSVPEQTIPLVASEMKPYDFSMSGIHEALKVLRDVKTKLPISIKIELTVPSELLGSGNTIAFKNLELQLPTDLIVEPQNGITYDPIEGKLKVDQLNVNSDGRASLTISATGLDLGVTKGTVKNGNLSINGEVGVLGGELYLDLTNVTLPSQLKITTDFTVSGFQVASFSGDIYYKMDAIRSEIELDDLPDFLDNEDTNIIIANPQIVVDICNPVADYNLSGKGKIMLTSIFKNDTYNKVSESAEFDLNESHSHLVFGSTKSPETNVAFDALGYVLTNLLPGHNPENPDYKPAGLPEKIKVEIPSIVFDGTVNDFPVKNDIGEASGNYEFKAPLGFGKGTKIIYETTEGDWGSDLEDVNITTLQVEANCTTNLPVSVQLSITPVDKNGKEIEVDEDSSDFYVPANANNVHVKLSVKAKKGQTIKDFDGVKFKAVVSQDSDDTDAIGPDLTITLDGLKATVGGYYETDF